MQLYYLQIHAHAGKEQIIDDPEKLVDPTRRALAKEFGIKYVSHRARGTAKKEAKTIDSLYGDIARLSQSNLLLISIHRCFLCQCRGSLGW
jgi:hypothetical protein